MAQKNLNKWDKVAFWVDVNLHNYFVASANPLESYHSLARDILRKTLRRIENAVNGVRYDPNR